DGFARQWHILIKGSIVAAGEGDQEAALRARELGALLLAREGIGAKLARRLRRAPAKGRNSKAR
ncbi:MAG TPA: hypothetical protein VLC47_13420, partial [Burkholderiales bacterium]|nr:hypothetical protein [Burkholderiales bacterium]